MYYYLYRNAAYKSRSMETIWQECPFWAGLSPPGGGVLAPDECISSFYFLGDR